MSEPNLLNSVILVIIGVVAGGVLTHLFSSWRDTRNKRREIRVRNLIEIFEAFDSSSLTDPTQEKIAMEKAISKVQLFGDESLVSLSRDFLNAMKQSGSFDTDPLMRKLGDEIRSELGLRRLSTNFVIMRYDEISPPGSSGAADK